MPTSSLPLDIKNLLTDHIESVAHLEVLFLFFNNPLTTWTAASLSKELRSSESSATKYLHLLSASGFIKTSGNENSFIYSPKDETLADDVRKLHEAFQQKPVAVISFLYEKPVDRLKGFADAFKIKKD